MGSSRSNLKLILVFSVIFVLGICGAFYIGQSGLISVQINLPASENQPVSEAPSTAEPIKAKVQESVPEDIAQDNSEHEVNENESVLFAKKFERFLNRFLKNFASEVREYKEFRRVLKEFKSPVNLENTTFAKESYDMFRQEIAPALRKKAHAVMLVFQDANEQVDILLMDQPKDTQERLKQVWKQMEYEHVHALVGFFESEETLVQAYEDLLKFYYVHSKNYTVSTAGKIIFTKDAYAEKEKALLKRIDDIKAAQRAALAQPQKQTPSVEN